MSTQTSPLQLPHWKTTLKHLFVRYRPKCWEEYAKIGLAHGPFEAQLTFAWNNLQTLNYMDHTIDSNEDVIFLNFMCFLKNFSIALKKSLLFLMKFCVVNTKPISDFLKHFSIFGYIYFILPSVLLCLLNFY